MVGNELEYIGQAINSGKISGNGDFTKKCQRFFEDKYGFKKCLLTSSCTDALEMCALLLDIKMGDEIIVPSFTFVSTANAFVINGAKIVFADSCEEHPNIAVAHLEKLITPKTKAIVIVHYAGMACDMDEILALAEKYNLYLIEDAAQGIDAFYDDKPLGSIGHLATFSFHETKNIISGEGGMLVINDENFLKRSEIVWEKGTNRSAFFRGEIDKYNWVDKGSSFLPSEITAAFLFAQLEYLNQIQEKRKMIWERYYESFKDPKFASFFEVPKLPKRASQNGHLFYLVCKSHKFRNDLIDHLKSKNILSVFHYLPLHKSPYFRKDNAEKTLVNSERFADCLIRLPLYFELTELEQAKVINEVVEFVTASK